MNSWRFLGLPLVLAVSLLGSSVWAGSDMSSSSYKIRRSDLNSGGSATGHSASNQLTDTVGSAGAGLLSGTTFFLATGFANLLSHPDSIEDLSITAGPTTGQLVLSWTAPTAYSSSSSANGYLVRISSVPIVTELDFVSATVLPVNWRPIAPGGMEVRSVTGLADSTTYYLSVKGVDGAGNAGYVSNAVGAATLTGAIPGVHIVTVGTGTVTVAWNSPGPLPDGYTLQASSISLFSALIYATTSTDPTALILAVGNLTHGKQYYLRLGGFNNGGVAGYTLAGSTITIPGPAPAGPAWSASQSSMTFTWTAVGADDGYVAEVYRDAGLTSLAGSASTPSGAAAALSVFSLIPNTTYYGRVRSVYDDVTVFSTVPALATDPVAPAGGIFPAVYPSSLTLTWSSGGNPAGSLFQVEVSSVADFGALSGVQTLSGFSTVFASLLEDTTYYARGKTLGWSGVNSAYTVFGSTQTQLAPVSALYFDRIGTSSMSLTWVSQSAPQIVYDAQLAPLTGPFSSISNATTAGFNSVFTDLSINMGYEPRVRARDSVSGAVSEWSAIISSYTYANSPVSLSTTSLSTTMVALQWSANGNPSGTLYNVERSTDAGVTFQFIAAPVSISYNDTTLSADTDYIYRVRALNGNSVPTATSNWLSLTTPGSRTTPKPPYDFWAGRSGNTVSYHWNDVTERTDNTPLLNLQGYQIYQSNDLFKPVSQWTMVGMATDTTWTTTAGAGPQYYVVYTMDKSGQISTPTHIMDDQQVLNHYWIADDGASRIVIPQVSADVLRAVKNQYSDHLEIRPQEIPQEETGRVVKSIRFDVVSAVTGEVLPGITFNPPQVQGIISYTVENGQVVQGSPSFGAQRLPIISAAEASQKLSLFVYTGVDWVKTTGQVNGTPNEVTFTGSRAGRYQVRVASHAPGVSVTKVYPRIITPNGDGWNDVAIFSFDNPELLPLSGKIFDITGSKIADLKPGPQPDSSLEWDGKDGGGKVVPAGIYLYQVSAPGTVMTGTLVVAR